MKDGLIPMSSSSAGEACSPSLLPQPEYRWDSARSIPVAFEEGCFLKAQTLVYASL